MSTLHILNGDSTLHGFKQSGLEGQTMVWREVLSEGPLLSNIASADFWKARSEWICQTFNEDPAAYQRDMIDHLAAITEPHGEINLWFEYDLHCQSNMLGVMNYLQQLTDLSGPAIYLICPSEFPGKPDFAGMGELAGEELTYLFENIRLQLSEADFAIAAEAWEIYVHHDADKLQKFLNETIFWGSLHSLKSALTAHLGRLVTNANGLNYIEQKLLDIRNSGITQPMEIYKAFWTTEKIYGMGDLELGMYLDKLRAKGLI